MQTLNYWKQFENTGKIADYLSYREHCGDGEEKSPKTVYGTGEVCADGRERMTGGPDLNAGYYVRMD